MRSHRLMLLKPWADNADDDFKRLQSLYNRERRQGYHTLNSSHRTGQWIRKARAKPALAKGYQRMIILDYARNGMRNMPIS